MTSGQAVEVGFGHGTETIALLAAGWRVLAIDAEPGPATVLRPRLPKGARHRLDVRFTRAQDAVLPPVDLLYASYALSFLSPADFRPFWASARAALRPGAFVVVNIFGRRDTWAGIAR